MFTGIVEEMGIIEKVVPGKLMHLSVRAQKVLGGSQVGDSINVNGVCLTITSLSRGRVTFDIIKETQDKANLKILKPGDGVNLERAMSVDSRFGGHIVSGHIDGQGTIKNKKSKQGEYLLEIQADRSIISHLVPKGSICVDGASLTIIDVFLKHFTIGFIPHTLKNTTLGFKEPKDKVNLEVDILSKYVFRYFESKASESPKISLEYLRRQGFGDI
jgi:riboflavin synthase